MDGTPEFIGRPSALSSETNPTRERRAASSSGYCSTVPTIFLWQGRLAVTAVLRPTKLPDIRTSFATFSFQASALHVCPPAPPLRGGRIFRHRDEWRGGEGE